MGRALKVGLSLMGRLCRNKFAMHDKQTMSQSTKIGLKIQSKSKWQNWIAIQIQIREKYWIDINPNPNPTHRKY